MLSPHSTVVVQRCCVFTIFHGAYIRLQIVEDMFPTPISKYQKRTQVVTYFHSFLVFTLVTREKQMGQLNPSP
jgi:hypothetical protein